MLCKINKYDMKCFKKWIYKLGKIDSYAKIYIFFLKNLHELIVLVSWQIGFGPFPTDLSRSTSYPFDLF